VFSFISSLQLGFKVELQVMQFEHLFLIVLHFQLLVYQFLIEHLYLPLFLLELGISSLNEVIGIGFLPLSN
jgi:hypothetical protein